MQPKIRPAVVGDASAISGVIIRALRETNAGDYTPEIITRVERSFSAAAIAQLIETRAVFVAVTDLGIVGTASLEGHALRTMFVVPHLQGQGIGRLLVQKIVAVAYERLIAVLAVPATVTAEAFYAKLGFTAVREVDHDGERTIVMERMLLPPAS